MKGLVILRTSAADKSVDGQGGITRGTYIDKNGVTHTGATLVGDSVFSSDGTYLGLVTEGTWTAA
ncbi:MAG: hypothetical protein IKX86_01535 [Clostridia bacterium]|nr:hypothetical protein [Clostridia bacterium]